MYPVVHFEEDRQVELGLGVRGLELEGLLELRDGLLSTSGGGERKPEIVVGLGKVRPQPERMLELGNGFIRAAGVGEGKAQIVMSFGESRIQQQRLPKVGDSLVRPAGTGQGEPETVLRLGIVRIDFQGPFQMGDRFGLAAQLAEGFPEVCLHLRIARLPGQRQPVLPYGFLQPPGIVKGDAQVAARPEKGWVDLKGPFIMRDGLRDLFTGYKEIADTVFRFSVAGVEPDGLLATGDRILDPAGLILRKSHVQIDNG